VIMEMRQGSIPLERKPKEITMSWNAPVVVEVCVGMEVTAYISAAM